MPETAVVLGVLGILVASVVYQAFVVVPKIERQRKLHKLVAVGFVVVLGILLALAPLIPINWVFAVAVAVAAGVFFFWSAVKSWLEPDRRWG